MRPKCTMKESSGNTDSNRTQEKSPTPLLERGIFYLGILFRAPNEDYLTSSKSTSSAVGLPLLLPALVSVVGPCCGPA